MTRSCAVPFEKRLVAALLLAFSPPALAQPTASTPVGSQALATTFEEVAAGMDEKLRGFQQEQHVPGLVWGVVRDGRLAHFGAVGRRDLNSDQAVDADSLFRIASMSKAFTALAILELRDQGRLRLDAAAEEYVPEMRRWRYPTTDSPRIRVRDLLAHVSGFVTDNEWGDRQQSLSEAAFSRMLRDGPPFNHAPQAQFEYSNYGYALLGRIITTVSGRPFNEYIEQEIMRPLGMASTGYDVFAAPRERRVLGYRWENDAWAREPDMAHGAFGAMGGVQTSANDYARWLAFLLSAWPARDGPEGGPVSRASVREMAQGLNYLSVRTRRRSDAEPCAVGAAYGMGLYVGRDCELGLTLSHGGAYPGYGAYMLLLPEHGVGFFAFSSRGYSMPISHLTATAIELFRAGLVTAPPTRVSDALVNNYAAVAAMYDTGSVAPGRDRLAMNFLMDRSADNWAREFTRLRRETGACETNAPIKATGALSGAFTWTCQHRNLQVSSCSRRRIRL